MTLTYEKFFSRSSLNNFVSKLDKNRVSSLKHCQRQVVTTRISQLSLYIPTALAPTHTSHTHCSATCAVRANSSKHNVVRPKHICRRTDQLQCSGCDRQSGVFSRRWVYVTDALTNTERHKPELTESMMPRVEECQKHRMQH